MLIEFNEENWPIPQKISLVGEELVFLRLLWNGELFLLKALGGAAQKQQCPLRAVEHTAADQVFTKPSDQVLGVLGRTTTPADKRIERAPIMTA